MNRRKFIEDIGLGSAFAWVACKLKPVPPVVKPFPYLIDSKCVSWTSSNGALKLVKTGDRWVELGFPHGLDSHPLRYDMACGTLKRVDKPIA